MGFTFVHAADLHLDTPFEGLQRVAPEIASALRDASLQAFDNLIEATLAADAVFLLLAGDLYDGAERDLRAQLRVQRGLERLSARGVQTFIIHGNHDPLDGWSAIRAWPAGVTVFPGDQVRSVPVERDGQTLATVHGRSFPTRDVRDNLALGYQRGSASGVHIGLLHCNVGEAGEHAAYSPCSLDDLRAARMDYWALGHIHKQQVLSSVPWVVYPGNTQGRSPKPSERGVKGAMLVRVEGRTIAPPHFVPLDVARFESVELDIAGVEDLADARGQLLEGARAAQQAHPDRGLLLRATLTGRGAAHADLARPGALAGLLRAVRDESREAEPFIWWDTLLDATAPDLQRDTIRARGDFSAEVIRLTDACQADASRLRELASEQFAALDASATAPFLNPPDDRELAALLRAAEIMALDLLEGRAR